MRISWVLENAEWTEQGPLKDRNDFPEWFLQVPLWVNTGWEGEHILIFFLFKRKCFELD
jgi:hypothetical protein